MSKDHKTTDRRVGSRVQVQRESVGMTQKQLADAIGVSAPKMAMYEQGADRISAYRLREIANALGVPVNAFFDLPSGSYPSSDGIGIAEPQSVLEGLRLVRAFTAIKSSEMRKAILKLVETLVNYE